MKNWAAWTKTAQTILDVRREGTGHEISLSVRLEAGDGLMPLVGVNGTPRAAYRTPPESNCSPSRALFGGGGHWVGAQDVAGPSTYVFQPDGLGPEQAVVLPLTNGSQGQAAGPDVFALELEFGVGVRVFDRAANEVFSSPPAAASYHPQVTSTSVLFLQANDTDDPSAWVWDRATGQFRELIGAGSNVVGDVRGDDETLVWIETPPVDPKRGGFPPGVLYTSPFTTDPKAIVPTARWSDLPVPPGSRATLGGGLYAAVGDATRNRLHPPHLGRSPVDRAHPRRRVRLGREGVALHRRGAPVPRHRDADPSHSPRRPRPRDTSGLSQRSTSRCGVAGARARRAPWLALALALALASLSGTLAHAAEPPTSVATAPVQPPSWTVPPPPVALLTSAPSTWTARWQPVPGAAWYLVELASDPAFQRVIARELVAAPSFTSTKTQGDTFVRVRAVAGGDAPGPWSEVRAVRGVSISVEPSRFALSADTLALPPCAELRFEGGPIEVAVGTGPFVPAADRIAVGPELAGRWRLRAPGGDAIALDVKVAPVNLDAAASREGDELQVVAQGELLPEAHHRCLALRARATAGRWVRETSLRLVEGGAHIGAIPWPAERDGSTRVEILDTSGRVLQTIRVPIQPREVLGSILPPLSLSPRTDAWWTAPSAPNAVAMGVGLGGVVAETQGVYRIVMQGSWRFLSLDASARTPSTIPKEAAPNRLTPGPPGTNVWLGLRGRIVGAENLARVLGAYARLGLPRDAAGTTHGDFGLSLGGLDGSFSWLTNLGVRPRLDDLASPTSPDLAHIYFLGGPAWNATDDLRIYLVGSAHALLVGAYRAGWGGTDDVDLEMRAHTHAGAEIQLGPVLLGPHVVLGGGSPGAEDVAVAAQVWVAYAPRAD